MYDDNRAPGVDLTGMVQFNDVQRWRTVDNTGCKTVEQRERYQMGAEDVTYQQHSISEPCKHPIRRPVYLISGVTVSVLADSSSNKQRFLLRCCHLVVKLQHDEDRPQLQIIPVLLLKT